MSDDESLEGASGNDSVPVDVPGALTALATETPLVTALTNSVTVSEVANVTLHWGGLPVMSEDREDAVELAAAASACLFNVGTVDDAELERMLAVGEAATERDVPVVFDPVGVGATERRSTVADRILADVDVAIVKGNHGEISALAGDDASVRGVESVGEYPDVAETAMACARDTGAVVVASGETDVVATADVAYELAVGHEMMGSFVGTGCMLGATLGAFAGALRDDGGAATGSDDAATGSDDASTASDHASADGHVLDAALAGTAAFGYAGERAASDGDWNGPASYRTAFCDAVAGLTASDVSDGGVADRIELVAER